MEVPEHLDEEDEKRMGSKVKITDVVKPRTETPIVDDEAEAGAGGDA